MWKHATGTVTIKKAWQREEKKQKKKKRKTKKKRQPGDTQQQPEQGENGEVAESTDEDESNWQGGPQAEEKAVEKHLKTTGLSDQEVKKQAAGSAPPIRLAKPQTFNSFQSQQKPNTASDFCQCFTSQSASALRRQTSNNTIGGKGIS